MDAVKVPLIIQMQSVESGSTALAMVLAAYGKWVPSDELRKQCRISRGGTRMAYLAAAARFYGMEAQEDRISLQELAREKLPLIVQWKRYQYAVVCAVDKGRVRLNDPRNGSLSLPLAQFGEVFTGRIIRLKPSADFVPGGGRTSTARYVWQRLSGVRRIAPGLMVLYAIGYLASLASLILVQIYLDSVMAGSQAGWYGPLVALMGICVAVNLLALSAQRIRLFHHSGRLAAASGAGLIRQLYHLPLRFFEEHFAGELMERLDNNDEIDKTILGTLLPLGIDSLMLIVYLILMFRYNPVVTAVCLGLEGACIGASLILQQRIVQRTRVLSRVSGAMNATALNGMETIETIKSMGAENNFFRLWSLSQSDYQNRKLDEQALRRYQTLLSGVHETLSSAAMLFISVIFIARGSLSLGAFAALQSMVGVVRAKAWAFVTGNDDIQSMRVQIERVEDVMVAEPENPIPPAGGEKAEKLAGGIAIRDMGYAYSAGEAPVFEDFSLTIAPGEWVGLVGPTGCGKSTLVKLIAGLYQPDCGTITYDGRLRRQIPDEVFYASLGVVDQETTLFEDTVAANLKMWDAAIGDTAMTHGAVDAQIHRRIMAQKGGYESRVLDSGKNLSGGERQRMEIARALARNPLVLLMDEATAALDALTEQRIIDALRARGITCLMVAHRLSAVRDCDRIVVMGRGRIVEMGTHGELIKKNGLYRKLVETQ